MLLFAEGSVPEFFEPITGLEMHTSRDQIAKETLMLLIKAAILASKAFVVTTLSANCLNATTP